MPLRGFLKCPRCGRNLTGSAAKGNGGIYFYYHCQLGCKERQKAEEANDRFVKRLGRAITKDKYITLFEKVAEHTYRQNSRQQSNATVAIQAEIDKHRLRISNAQQLMLDGELSAADYREIKGRYEPEIEQLERKKKGVSQVDANLIEYASATADLLRNLPRYYKKATLPVKQKIIGSICSGKLVFNENDYQTMEFNDIIQGICKLGEHFDELEKGQASNYGSLSEEVTRIGSSLACDYQIFMFFVDHFVDLVATVGNTCSSNPT